MTELGRLAASVRPPRRPPARRSVARYTRGTAAASVGIQPHGLLFGLDAASLRITHASANAEAHLGRAAASLIGRPVHEVIDQTFTAALAAFASNGVRGTGPMGEVTLQGAQGEVSGWRATSHRAGAAIIAEMAPILTVSGPVNEFLFDAATALQAIGENTGVSATASALARTLRDMTGHDRVLVMRFDAAGNAGVLAESRAPTCTPSLAGFHLRAEEISPAVRQLALRDPVRMIVDLAAPAVPLETADEGAPLDLSEAILRAPIPAQAHLWSRLNAKSAVMMTLAPGKRLWGFVIFLHRTPRRLSMPHRSTLRLMAEAIAVRFATAEEIEDQRDVARRRRAVAQFQRALIRDPGDSVPAMLRRHGKALLRVVGADGAWCHLPDADFAIGDAPPPEIARRIAALCRMRSGIGVFATDHLARLDAELASSAGNASGALFAILPRSRGALLFFRGRASAERNPDGASEGFLAARAEAWRAERSAHSAPWSPADLAVAPEAAQSVDDLAPRLAERRNMRRVLENEAKLQAILDATQDGLIVIDGDGKLLDFSPGAERLFGWPAAEVVGQPLENLIAERARAAHRPALASATLDLRPRIVGDDGKLLGLRKDGSTFPLEVTLTSVVLHGETMYVGALRDITERLGAALRDRFWFQHSTIAYSVSDPFSQQRLRVNPALCRLLGYDEAELLAMPVLATTHPDDIPAAQSWREHVGAGNDEPLRRVQRLVRKDGGIVHARITALPMRYPGSETVHVVAEIVDISDVMEADTRLRAALARAESANATKSKFLATMSHELRTPLNAIIGMSEMIAAEVMGPLGNARYREYVNDIHKAGRHLLDLVSDVLDTSRIETGGYHLAPMPLEIGEVIDEMHRIVAPLAAARGVVLERRVADGLPVIRADRRALKQVLINVVSNAIKFTPDRGMIAIRASADGAPRGGGIAITVADTGTGIAPEHLPHVTEPFYRAGDAYTTGPASGAGLGLSIANRLVEAHGGSLDIASHVGRGTTVTLRFPPGPA